MALRRAERQKGKTAIHCQRWRVEEIANELEKGGSSTQSGIWKNRVEHVPCCSFPALSRLAWLHARLHCELSKHLVCQVVHSLATLRTAHPFPTCNHPSDDCYIEPVRPQTWNRCAGSLQQVLSDTLLDSNHLADAAKRGRKQAFLHSHASVLRRAAPCCAVLVQISRRRRVEFDGRLR